MPFEPRIIRADDEPVATDEQVAQGEGLITDDLPSDLECLAGQLSDDAAFLSAKYPAGLAEKVAEAAVAEQRRRGKGWRMAVTAAGVLFALGTVWFSSYRVSTNVETQPVAKSAGQSPVHGPMVELIESPNVAAAQPVVPVVNSQDFMDLDPADREAVVDLMLEGQLQQPEDISL